MNTKFICLANSYKEGGRCIAGIEIDNNNPILINNRPKWIRPICNTEHVEVPSDFVEKVNILDVLEIKTLDRPTEINYQSENIYFDVHSIKVIDSFNKERLNELCDNKKVIFGNKGKAVASEFIMNLNYSLMLIRTNQFNFYNRTYENTPDRNQIRMKFLYNSNNYDLPVTDPVFLRRYENNPDFAKDLNIAYIGLSLGICWQDWYYKLVTTIIF